MNGEHSFVGPVALWLFIFPLTYSIHIAEEYFGGEGFSAYQERARGVDLSPARFLALNGLALVLMIVGILLAVRLGFPQLMLSIFGAVVLINGLSHTINSLISARYNPGLVSGLVLWLPLGAFTLLTLLQTMPRGRYFTGVAIGIGIHAIVSLVALTGGKSLAFFTR
jgi:hypothetical protein